MKERIYEYEPLWGEWNVDGLIGEGSFGKVYKVKKIEFGEIYYAAVKIITIPQSETEIKHVYSEGMDSTSVKNYYENFVRDLLNEIRLMSNLKGVTNIVSLEDHKIIERQDSIGWDILLRMELLSSLPDYLSNYTLSYSEILKLGIDICKALELCQKCNIIHRDIKPDNIFVSKHGDFKLGDFGIARQIERTMTGLSKKGTFSYMAPEVYKGLPYNSTVDIYSLGLVLYRFLNNNRTPFLPDYPAPLTHNSREEALVRRIRGETFPKPINAEGRLGEIILKACSYNPKERYENPSQMRGELEAIQTLVKDCKAVFPEGDSNNIVAQDYFSNNSKEGSIGKTESIFAESADIKEPKIIEDLPEKDEISGKPEENQATQTLYEKVYSKQRIEGTEPEEVTEKANSEDKISEKQVVESNNPVVMNNGKRMRVIGIAAGICILVLLLIIIIPLLNIKHQLSLGNDLLTRGKYQEAISAFQKIVAHKHNNIDGRIGLAKAYTELGMYDDAEEVLKKAMELNPKLPDIYTGLADIYEKQKNIISVLEILGNGYEATNSKLIEAKLSEVQARIFIPDIRQEVARGSEVKLPSTVQGKWDNKYSIDFPINWDNSPIDTNRVQTLTVTGSIKNYDNKVSLTLWIDDIVNFTDKNLESVIRSAINKNNGEIYNSDVGSIIELDASYCQIEDLSGIEFLTGLEKLDLTGNWISDITPLKGMINLKELELKNNNITNVEALDSLSNLEKLCIGNYPHGTNFYNEITDISSIKKMVKLKELDLNSLPITNIEPLNNLVELEILNLSFVEFMEPIPSTNLKKLKYLDLSYSKAGRLSNYKNSTNLTYLDLNNTYVQNGDIVTLRNMKNLTELYIINGNISDISTFKGLTKLKHLELHGNPISDSDKQALKDALPGCEVKY